MSKNILDLADMLFAAFIAESPKFSQHRSLGDSHSDLSLVWTRQILGQFEFELKGTDIRLSEGQRFFKGYFCVNIV